MNMSGPAHSSQLGRCLLLQNDLKVCILSSTARSGTLVVVVMELYWTQLLQTLQEAEHYLDSSAYPLLLFGAQLSASAGPCRARREGLGPGAES